MMIYQIQAPISNNKDTPKYKQHIHKQTYKRERYKKNITIVVPWIYDVKTSSFNYILLMLI